VQSPAARGNYISEAVRAVQFPGSNSGIARSQNRMTAFEPEIYRTFREVGADDRHLFAGRRGVWENDDWQGTTNRGWRSSSDNQYLRSGQRAVLEDAGETQKSI